MKAADLLVLHERLTAVYFAIDTSFFSHTPNLFCSLVVGDVGKNEGNEMEGKRKKDISIKGDGSTTMVGEWDRSKSACMRMLSCPWASAIG